MTKQELIEHLKTKPNWNSGEIIHQVNQIKNNKFNLTKPIIKIGDLYGNTYINHPIMVIKVTKEYVYGVCITSEESYVGILQTNSRFINGWFTTTIIKSTISHVENNIFGVYDNRTNIFLLRKLLKQHYKTII